ncbi:MAG: winged helix-turn-helix domain-containing protein [Xanthobacteraceae bacterium]
MPNSASVPANRAIAFGPFLLSPAKQLLLEDGKPVHIGARALEILTFLVERAGDLVSKDEMIARVWPSTFVQESNLKVHVAALRRVLGDGRDGNRYVVNVPGRGYRFVAEISHSDVPLQEPASARAGGKRHNLPALLSRIIGRDEIISTITAHVSKRRFVSIVGPGGIGKTTVALAIANELISTFKDVGRFVDLAPLKDAALVPSLLASLFGVPVYSGKPIPNLAAFLEDKNMLIVLDSCEHIIEAVAELTESLLKSAPGLHILATSREPLRASGEFVRRLPPLEMPPESFLTTAADAVASPAVQLFVERASASVNNFEMTDTDALLVANICRRLDGNPLAIELAAGRVDAFGIDGVAKRLVDRFGLLKSGRRTALPRHQALAATLDWSYDLLTDTERAVLRRLSVFSGEFLLEAVTVVAVGGQVASSEVVDCVAKLVSKSLVAAEVNDAVTHYRLLDTTRAYAREKLAETAEVGAVARKHAEYCRDLLERAGIESTVQNPGVWLIAYGGQVDNVRAALDWAFSADGDASIGISLTIAAVPLWINLSLMDECRQRVRRALSDVRMGDGQVASGEMRLLAALGAALFSIGPAPESKTVWTHVLEIAESLQETDYRLRAFWGLWTVCVTGDNQRKGLSLARMFANLASETADPHGMLMGDRLLGTSHHFLGEHDIARRHIERSIAGFELLDNTSHTTRFLFDQSLAARIYLAKIDWLRGFPDKAMHEVRSCVDDAQKTGHSLSLCYALGLGACATALLVGDLATAERYVAMLLDHSVRHVHALWDVMGRYLKGAILVRSGNHRGGLQLLQTATNQFREAGFVLYRTASLGELAESWGSVGNAATALAAIDEALLQSKLNDELWCIPELLRIKGEMLVLEAGPDAAARAEEHFSQSLDLARQQNALSWELRTAISFSRLKRDQNCPHQARDLLVAIYARFTEGFKTADLQSASRLLSELN